MTVGERIVEKMKQAGLSQNKLAKKADLSQSGMSSIINGAVSPKEVTLKQIAEALNCSVAELLGEYETAVTDVQISGVKLTEEEYGLITDFRMLSRSGQEKVRAYARDLYPLYKHSVD